jgi:hypothetical protein
VSLFPLPGILQNLQTPVAADDSPFLDLIQGSKTTETGIVIVEATVSYARGLNDVVGLTHGVGIIHGGKKPSGEATI